MMNSKWVFQIGLGLLLAVIILNALPLISGYEMAQAPAPAPVQMLPEMAAPPAPMMLPETGTPASVADVALARPPVAQGDVAPSPASVAEVALANPPVAAPPVYTTASPMPRLESSSTLVQTQPSLDPSMNAMFAQSQDPMIRASMQASQKVVLPQPPATIQAPPMAQGISSTIVGMDI